MDRNAFITSSYPRYLGTPATRNWADATVEKARELAGKSRYLYELVAGEALDSAEAPVAVNPQRLVGVDMSGPPWGSALFHPIATWGGIASGAASSWTKVQHDQSLAGAGSSRTWEADVWVKAHARYRFAPYSRGAVFFRAKAASSFAGCAIELEANGRLATVSYNVTTSEVTTLLQNEDPDAYLDLVPGFNRLRIRATNQGSVALQMLGICVAQTVKRSHDPALVGGGNVAFSSGFSSGFL